MACKARLSCREHCVALIFGIGSLMDWDSPPCLAVALAKAAVACIVKPVAVIVTGLGGYYTRIQWPGLSTPVVVSAGFSGGMLDTLRQNADFIHYRAVHCTVPDLPV